METNKLRKIPRPDSDLPTSERTVIRPTVERMRSSRIGDTRGRAIDFDNTVLMNMGEGMYTVDVNGCVTSMNQTAEILFQRTFEEMVGRKMHDLTHYVHRDGSAFPAEECAGFGVLRNGKTIKNYEDVFIRADGSFFDVIYSSSPIREHGAITGLVVVFRDVSEQKRTLAALRESEERFEKAFNASPMALLISSAATGKLIEVNDTFVELFGFSREDVVGLTTADFGLWVDPAERAAEAQSYLSTGQIRNTEHRFRTRSGEEIIGLLSAERIDIGGDVCVLSVIQNITERRRAEEDLRRANDELEMRVSDRTQELAEANDLLRREMDERAYAEDQRMRLLRRLFTVQEDERGRIARDIHDQLGQRLTALRLKIASLRDITADDAIVSQRVNRLQEIAEHLDSEVSFLAWELRPSVLDDVSFVTALDNYVAEWSRHSDIYAEFDAIGLTNVELGSDIEVNLYRITQEALNNAAKHAAANHITVLLEKQNDDVMLIIEDNGIGFDPEIVVAERGKGGGFGLFGMRERAALISGTLEIESSPNKGTSVFVRVPLS